MNNTLQDLYRQMQAEEERLRTVRRRARWLEARLIESKTAEEFDTINAELLTAEREIEQRTYIAMIARLNYNAAEISARAAALPPIERAFIAGAL